MLVCDVRHGGVSCAVSASPSLSFFLQVVTSGLSAAAGLWLAGGVAAAAALADPLPAANVSAALACAQPPAEERAYDTYAGERTLRTTLKQHHLSHERCAVRNHETVS